MDLTISFFFFLTRHQQTQRKTTPPKNQCRKNAKQRTDDEAIHYGRLKNFVVVPQNDFHQKHIALDGKALFDLVKDLRQFQKLMNQAEFLELESDHTNANTKTVNPFWYFLFNIRKPKQMLKSSAVE